MSERELRDAGIRFERDVAVPMRDGATLRANVFRPAEGKRVPVLLSVTPYGKDKLPDRIGNFFMWLAGVRFGVDWSAIAYLDETTWLTVPALVIHGDEDLRVPVSISATLKERHPSLADFEVFPGAGHLESWNIDRARYMALLRSFLTPVAP